MKIFRLLQIILITSFSLPAFAETDSACLRSSGDIIVALNSNIVTDDNGNLGASCKEAPDFYRIKFYKFALCKSNPLLNSTNDFSSCSYLVDSSAGVSHVITYPSTALLATNSVLTPGTYNFLLLVLDNSLQQKHTETFTRTMTGATGTGKTCWTLEKSTAYGGNTITGITTVSPDPDTRSSLAMECGGTSSADPKYTTEIFETMGCDGGPPCFENKDINGGVYVRLLTTDNITNATSVNNSKRIAVAMPMVRTVKATSSYEIGFKVNGSSSIDLHYDSGATKLTAMKIGADPFQVSFTVK